MGLSPRQQSFVNEYLRCGNASEAYRRAGYSARTVHQTNANAARLMANDSVRSAIEAGRAAARAEEIVSRNDILEGLRREAKRLKHGSPQARVAAWKLLAEMLGLTGDAALQKSIDELMRRLNEREAQEGGRGSGPAAGGPGSPPPA